ncbi:MAG: hypothetical protein HC892_20695 [Saprospiraceae bacterium]|nr:hypothetical protein [Saprospiraceae bacterium]
MESNTINLVKWQKIEESIYRCVNQDVSIIITSKQYDMGATQNTLSKLLYQRKEYAKTYIELNSAEQKRNIAEVFFKLNQNICEVMGLYTA